MTPRFRSLANVTGGATFDCQNVTLTSLPTQALKCECAHPLFISGDASTVIDYASFAYCSPASWKIVLLCLYCLYLFLILGSTADEYLVPSLTHLSTLLKMSPELAGVTMLALANGAPDFFTSLSAFGDSRQANVENLALSATLAAGTFVSAFVFGTVIICQPFAITLDAFLRDWVTYFISLLYLTVIFHFNKITVLQASIFPVLYLVYIAIVVYMEHRLKRVTAKTTTKIMIDSETLRKDFQSDQKVSPNDLNHEHLHIPIESCKTTSGEKTQCSEHTPPEQTQAVNINTTGVDITKQSKPRGRSKAALSTLSITPCYSDSENNDTRTGGCIDIATIGSDTRSVNATGNSTNEKHTIVTASTRERNVYLETHFGRVPVRQRSCSDPKRIGSVEKTEEKRIDIIVDDDYNNEKEITDVFGSNEIIPVTFTLLDDEKNLLLKHKVNNTKPNFVNAPSSLPFLIKTSRTAIAKEISEETNCSEDNNDFEVTHSKVTHSKVTHSKETHSGDNDSSSSSSPSLCSRLCQELRAESNESLMAMLKMNNTKSKSTNSRLRRFLALLEFPITFLRRMCIPIFTTEDGRISRYQTCLCPLCFVIFIFIYWDSAALSDGKLTISFTLIVLGLTVGLLCSLLLFVYMTFLVIKKKPQNVSRNEIEDTPKSKPSSSHTILTTSASTHGLNNSIYSLKNSTHSLMNGNSHSLKNSTHILKNNTHILKNNTHSHLKNSTHRLKNSTHENNTHGLSLFHPEDLDPILSWTLSLLALCAACFFQFMFANEIVGVVTLIGDLLGISPSVLGLFVAFGNSIGDFIGNTALARAGSPRTAAGGCFGGTVFNLNIALGIGLIRGCLSDTENKAFLTFDKASDVMFGISFVCLPLMLVIVLISVLYSMRKWNKLVRPFGFMFVGIYIVYFILVLLMSLDIIDPISFFYNVQ
eukprot:g2525.t1